MRIIFFFIFFLSLSYSFYLKKEYRFVSDDIYAKDIKKDIKKDFYLLSIPSYKKDFKVSSKELIKKFKEKGLNLSSSFKYINFKRDYLIKNKFLENKISNVFKNRYPFLDVKKVIITSAVPIDIFGDNFKFKVRVKRINKGTFLVEDENNKRYFLNYEIIAYYFLYKAKKTLRKGELISKNNIYKTKIFFNKINNIPLDFDSGSKYMVKQKINKDSIITNRKLNRIFDVRKGQVINAKFINDNIVFEVYVKVLKNAFIGDIINVQRNDGVRLKVKVLSKNLLEIQ